MSDPGATYRPRMSDDAYLQLTGMVRIPYKWPLKGVKSQQGKCEDYALIDDAEPDTFGCPCCPEFSTHAKDRLHDHFGSADCPFWERVFNGEVYVHVDE